MNTRGILVVLIAMALNGPSFAERFYKGHSEYEAPYECRVRTNKICRVPESIFNKLTQEEKAWAYSYAKENNIPYMIVRNRHSAYAKSRSLY